MFDDTDCLAVLTVHISDAYAAPDDRIGNEAETNTSESNLDFMRIAHLHKTRKHSELPD
ncbi:hypothetical protein [Ruegeria sp.]|uniref:hypothetical protein n=1 Tax=Ruegeria sp. TaxID=1879320 RepID=UPI002327F292|nr:hypothetical protein [Ruegeria sp.]MDA7963235.1 hypothetical protein [Ruegeria sp.]